MKDWDDCPQMHRCAHCGKELRRQEDAFSYSYYFELAWCSVECRRAYEDKE